MAQQLDLIPYTDAWPDNDPDAGFRSMVAMFSGIDPLPTLERLSQNGCKNQRFFNIIAKG